MRRQSSLFYLALGAEASLIKDDLLDEISPLLEDEEMLRLVTNALGRRAAGSRKTGRDGIAPDRVLRCIVLQRIKGWSLREPEERTAHGRRDGRATRRRRCAHAPR